MEENHEEVGQEEELNWPQLLNLLVQILRLVPFIVIGIWTFREFVLNPNHNISTYLKVEHSYTMGVTCKDEGYVRWSLKILKIQKNGSVTSADALLRQIDRDGNLVDPQEVVLYEKQTIKFPCESGEIEGPLMWDMNEEAGIQLRHPKSFEIGEMGNGP